MYQEENKYCYHCKEVGQHHQSLRKEKFGKKKKLETPQIEEISNKQEEASSGKRNEETQAMSAAVGGEDSMMQTAVTEVQNSDEMRISGLARAFLDSASGPGFSQCQPGLRLHCRRNFVRGEYATRQYGNVASRRRNRRKRRFRERNSISD